MAGVLVLNASYEPLHTVSVKRAVVLLLKEKAELLESDEAFIHSAHLSLPRPLVIRLYRYVHVPRHWSVPLTRRNLLLRDEFTCQYCGKQPGLEHLTIDHVVPRSRGGEHSWENLVVACIACNRRKGNYLPHEIGMTLLRKPFRPRYFGLTLLGNGNAPDIWKKYIYA
ncbi:hypothetical protein ARMA_0043 [Ardenticatena maritima]|uniref:HNH endonuclease n=1 Tax=Ardenticatena maritima TaxID=872965 RepID=A0A0M9UBD0_9CHLR|nr:HNH endonuclease [Ardenticatena maritima]KPL88613.1 HNH endonuclease [Ardenticatena maritima]GAP61620.1 hypothetical protein ARMA_0043 [Ardenticatena maritima]